MCDLVIYNITEPFLQLDCYDITTNRLTFSVPLMPLYEHEIELNSGRFKNYSLIMFPNKTYLRYDSRLQIPLIEWFCLIISWINEIKTKNHWSFSGRIIDEYRAEFIFGFDDVAISFMFAMVWI
jgi:hypothetical protein